MQIDADAGSSRWLAERRHLLRGGAAYSPRAGGSASPRWLSCLAAACLVWALHVGVNTLAVRAVSRFGNEGSATVVKAEV